MNVHVLQHASFEGLGYIENWLAARNALISQTHLYETPVLPALDGIDLVVAMGGPMSVNDEAALPWLREDKGFIREAVHRGIPVLGICLGAQLIASALGARVYPNQQKEIGWFPIEGEPAAGDVFTMPAQLKTFHWHGETFDLPSGAVRLARSAATANQAFQVGRRTLAIQFHPEATPAVVKAFVDNSDGELQPATFVQTADVILSAPASAYTAANDCLSRALDYLTAR